MSTFELNEDRFFDPDPATRKIARELYENVKNLPIVSPHGHVDPEIFINDEPFPNPTELFIIPDHYISRMLYSQGIPFEELDIPKKDGSQKGIDPKKIWKLFASNYYLYTGTPSGVWLDYEFSKVFGITKKLNGDNAVEIYDIINEKLKSPEFYPKSLFNQLNIEVLSTTNSATDSLEAHKKIHQSDWKGRVIPCFRPDAVTNILEPEWEKNIGVLEKLTGKEINSFKSFLEALEQRREFFKSMGATSTDHGVTSPFTHKLTDTEADEIFQRALQNNATPNDAYLFTANILMEMARMSIEDGLVMQIHPGSFRNHNEKLYEMYGADKGGDIPLRTEYTNNLKELLNEFGNDSRLSLIVFTLDESNYSRELAPLAGHYPALKLGPAWWFNDSIEGMTRFRKMVTETAGFYNTVGFNDDTRAFVSIPARHDLSRRVDSNFLAGLVTRHIISQTEATVIGRELAYELVKKSYKL